MTCYISYVVYFKATGDVGADSGHEDAICQANLLLRVIYKNLGLEFFEEIMGMLISHSIIKKGQKFPVKREVMYFIHDT